MKSFTILVMLSITVSCQDSIDTSSEQPDLNKSQVWGFGILAGFGISLMGFIAAIILVGSKKCCKQIIFNNLIKFMFALAFGALLGDAIVHILAQAFANPDIDGNVASAIFIASILIFIFIDRLLHAYGVAHTHWVQGQHGHTHNQHEHDHDQHDHKNHKHQNNVQNNEQKHSNSNQCNINHNNVNKLTSNVPINKNIQIQQNPQTNCNIIKQKCGAQMMAATDIIINNQHILCPTIIPSSTQLQNNIKSSTDSNSTQNKSIKQKIKSCLLNLKGKQSKGYMNILGSFIHNFIDGLAIGVTFATGNKHQIVPVVIAVIAHQIPRQLGDVAILMKSRFSGIQTILCNGTINFLSLFGVIAGLAAVNLSDAAQTYIMVSVAGNFIYIAADIWQNLFRNTGKGAKKQNFMEFIGAAVGIGAMFGIKFIQE